MSTADEHVIDSAGSGSPDRVQLEVWSDVACPWCYLGRRNLSVALEDLDERDRPDVQWRAFQLDPSVPVDGTDAEAYFAKRFGDAGALDEARQRLVALGEEVGIDFRFDRQRVISNTLRAHAVIAAAREFGHGEEVMDAMFSAYFEQGLDVGDVEVLRTVTVTALGEEAAQPVLETAATSEDVALSVATDIDLARQLQITGVPCFVADRAIAVPGAVPPPVLAQLLAEARTRREGIA